MAGEAGFEDLRRAHERKCAGDGGLAAAGLHMSFGGTMAAFAAGALGRQVSSGDALIMRVLVEVEPHVGVAGFAGLAAHVSGGRGLCAGNPCRQREEYKGTYVHPFNYKTEPAKQMKKQESE